MIDLDAARAARAERTGPQRLLRLGGQDFALPRALPVACGFALRDDDARAFLAALLGDQMPAFMALGPDQEDLTALMAGLLAEYGVSSGESKASPPRSRRTGKR